MNSKTKHLITVALYTGIISVFSIITIPMYPVPITLGLFAVLFVGASTDAKTSFKSVFVYILIGLAGLPVFSMLRGGFSVIAGPTGGYILSYLIIAPLCSILLNLFKNRTFCIFFSTFVCLFICYTCAVTHYMFVCKSLFLPALFNTVIPFIGADVIKAIFAFYLAQIVKKKIHYQN